MNYSIKYVSTVTGLSEHRIRAWEKRYQLLSPSRSPKGRRLYDDQDIHKLNLIAGLINKGSKIGELAPLTIAQLEAQSDLSSSGHLNGRSFESAELELKMFILHQALNKNLFELFEHEMKRPLEVSVKSYFEDLLLPVIKLVPQDLNAIHGKARFFLQLIELQLKELFYEVHLNGIDNSQKPLVVASLNGNVDNEIESWVCALKLSLAGNNVLNLGRIDSAEVLVAMAQSLKPKKIVLSDHVDRPGREWKYEEKLYQAFRHSPNSNEELDLEILILLEGISKPLYCPFFQNKTRAMAFPNLESITGHLSQAPDSVDYMPSSA